MQTVAVLLREAARDKIMPQFRNLADGAVKMKTGLLVSRLAPTIICRSLLTRANWSRAFGRSCAALAEINRLQPLPMLFASGRLNLIPLLAA